MSDDNPLTRFLNKGMKPTASAAPPHAARGRHAPVSREPYEAFDNQVRAMSIEIRVWRTGLSYSIDYGQLGARVFRFMTGEQLMFDGSGYSVVIQGVNLREILRAINLHTCGFIQDFHPDYFVLPQPVDEKAPRIESIEVQVLRPVLTKAKEEV